VSRLLTTSRAERRPSHPSTSPHPQEAKVMKFWRWLSVLLLTLVPMNARAISLQWVSGSTQMS
jgi:hypothetical protein